MFLLGTEEASSASEPLLTWAPGNKNLEGTARGRGSEQPQSRKQEKRAYSPVTNPSPLGWGRSSREYPYPRYRSSHYEMPDHIRYPSTRDEGVEDLDDSWSSNSLLEPIRPIVGAAHASATLPNYLWPRRSEFVDRPAAQGPSQRFSPLGTYFLTAPATCLC